MGSPVSPAVASPYKEEIESFSRVKIKTHVVDNK